MNLGDGLKLETESMDGRTRLILSPYGIKAKIVKYPLKMKQTGRVLKPTRNTCIRSENLAPKKTVGSETNCEESRGTFSPCESFCEQCAGEDCPRTPMATSSLAASSAQTRPSTHMCVCDERMPHESVASSMACLTQAQLQQIWMAINQGSGPITQQEKGEETSQDPLHLNTILMQPKDESIMGLLQRPEAVSSVPEDKQHVFNKNREASKQLEQKTAIENEWKPADIFSTLGERERHRSLLEARRAQWRKDLDEQVALKKKEKEASEKWNSHRKKPENDKIVLEKFQIPDHSREASLLDPSSSAKQEQQRKWMEDFSKQVEENQQKRAEENLRHPKGEEHNRWAMHSDPLRSQLGSQSQLSSPLSCKHPEYICVSPDTQEPASGSNTCTSIPASQVQLSVEEHVAKPGVAVANSQKTNFLRSMTALLDPAQIEERDRRRQKQLEHQKAITAQVEEKRRKKQLEEEQRRKEEQEEERRLAREREEMQRQYEEDVLRQKQKEETMTLKTNELLHTVQRAQELAQRLKQEHRIRELTRKGHDTSRLIKNLSSKGSARISLTCGDNTDECSSSASFPKKDAGVQTDDLCSGMFTSAWSPCGPGTERATVNASPEVPVEFYAQFCAKKDKQEVSVDKGVHLEKENSWCNDQYSPCLRTETHTKLSKDSPKKPAWNINRPLKRYVPASEKYPKQLQKQREEKKMRRQMELLHLVERNHRENLSEKRGFSAEAVTSSHEEPESESRGHRIKEEEEALKIPSSSKERFQLLVPALNNRTQQTQTISSHIPLKDSGHERETSENAPLELSNRVSEPSHFIPYVRTNEIYYLDPDAPLSRPSTQASQYQNSHDCDKERQLPGSDQPKDPLLNPSLVKNRDRQQAILKGLSELRQGLLQKQKELETNLIPLAANQEDNFSSLL
uniref:Coiled-coil domain containing 66 n=1 Tax=Jaculus jaculus TaxID=51337 RepID=A0A8C5KKV3_JACJA